MPFALLVVVLVLSVGPDLGRHIFAASASPYPYLSGFPIKVQGRIESAPTVADIDRDGRNEVLVAAVSGTQSKIYAWSNTGSLRPGYPLTIAGRITASLALGDLNGDGDLEIVASVSSTAAGVKGKVFVWQPDGTPLPGWPQSVDLFDPKDNSEISSVVLANMDSDAALEVIAGTDNNILGTSAPSGSDVPNLYVWKATGQPVTGNWPAQDGPAIRGTVAAGDLNADGRTDLVVGRDYQYLFAYDQQGNALPGWPIATLVSQNGGDQTKDARVIHKRSMPSLADLDGDGKREVVVAGTRKLPGSTINSNSDVLVLEPNGSRQPGWETSAGGKGFLGNDVVMDQAPAIADLNSDGQPDIVVPTQDGWIRAYTANKTLLWEFNYAQGQVNWSSEPVIGDIDNDGLNEVVFGTYDPNPQDGTQGPVGLWILENDGRVKTGAPLAVEAPGIKAAPSLIDLNGDGYLDIIAAGRQGTNYAWNTQAPVRATQLPWPVARQNLQRTAVYK